jgi:hypothetical protein
MSLRPLGYSESPAAERVPVVEEKATAADGNEMGVAPHLRVELETRELDDRIVASPRQPVARNRVAQAVHPAWGRTKIERLPIAEDHLKLIVAMEH